RNLVNAYLDEASKAVSALGGHVLKRLGDGLMALFGYPQAQESGPAVCRCSERKLRACFLNAASRAVFKPSRRTCSNLLLRASIG
ncbi:MAG: hypothetical protein WBW14_26755, partial [Candidatus Acidiferrum sp.]